MGLLQGRRRAQQDAIEHEEHAAWPRRDALCWAVRVLVRRLGLKAGMRGWHTQAEVPAADASFIAWYACQVCEMVNDSQSAHALVTRICLSTV